MKNKNEDLPVKEVLNSFKAIMSPVSEMHGGMMNRSFIMVDQLNFKYVLYIPTAQSNSMVDRDIEHKALNTYVDLGIAPKNIYFDERTGVKINTYIPGESLDHVVDVDYDEVARLILTERKGPLMNEYYNPFQRFVNFEKEMANSLIPHLRSEFKTLRKVIFDNRVIMEKGKIVLSHNDFQRSNVIKSSTGIYYLIDYEFAMNNYEMYDIACFGNNDVQDGLELLKHVYKTPKVKDYEAYYLWRIFISLQWYIVALIKDFSGEGKAHNIDFIAVADFFIDNALEAYDGLLSLKN